MTRTGLRNRRGAVTAACATLLWAGTALAVSEQQYCEYQRVTAWAKFQWCVDHAVARDLRGESFDWPAAFAKCRHKYFRRWTAFQSKSYLAGTTCAGTRFTDNGDQTVTDNLSGLVWEEKTDDGSLHDVDNLYTWSTGSPYKENGTAFTTFLGTLFFGTFAGANGWRLPTFAELNTIVLDFECSTTSCSCPSVSCFDPALGPTIQGGSYWSATTDHLFPENAMIVGYNADVGWSRKTMTSYAIAVRGGL